MSCDVGSCTAGKTGELDPITVSLCCSGRCARAKLSKAFIWPSRLNWAKEGMKRDSEYKSNMKTLREMLLALRRLRPSPIQHVWCVNSLGIVQTLFRITFVAPAALLDFSVDQTQLVASNRIQPCFLLTKQQNSSANKKWPTFAAKHFTKQYRFYSVNYLFFFYLMYYIFLLGALSVPKTHWTDSFYVRQHGTREPLNPPQQHLLPIKTLREWTETSRGFKRRIWLQAECTIGQKKKLDTLTVPAEEGTCSPYRPRVRQTTYHVKAAFRR